MKTFTKKTLSVVLAMLMALSTLTVGAFSAFAAEKEYNWNAYSAPVVANIADTTATTEPGRYVFTPSATGLYAIKLSAVPYGVNKTINDMGDSYVDVYVQNEKKPNTLGEEFTTVGDGYATSVYSVVTNGTFKTIEDYENVEIQVPAGNTLISRNEAYVPGITVVPLSAGETYQFVVKTGDNTTSTFSIEATDFYYSYTSYTAELEYNSRVKTTGRYDSEKDEYIYEYNVESLDAPIARTYTVGIGVSVRGYDGSSTTVAIPETIDGMPVKSVSMSNTGDAFRKNITSITLPNGVEKISSMNGMTKLSSINIPASLKEIEEECFYGDIAIKGEIFIPETVKTVGSWAFYNTGITRVTVADKETEIGNRAFGFADVLNEATPNPRDTVAKAVEDFTVIAPADSLAAKYAVNNGFATYDPANCTIGNHPFKVTSTPATLFAAGREESVCPCCGATSKKTLKKKTFKISKLKGAKKAFTVKVGKQAVKGFVVEYSTSKKFTKKTTKSVTVNGTSVSKKIKGLKKGKYFVRVRAFNKVNGKKVYSKYTAVKSVKVK